MDCGEEASHWVSDFLKRKCRLIEHCQQDGRTSKLGGINCVGCFIQSSSLNLKKRVN